MPVDDQLGPLLETTGLGLGNCRINGDEHDVSAGDATRLTRPQPRPSIASECTPGDTDGQYEGADMSNPGGRRAAQDQKHQSENGAGRAQAGEESSGNRPIGGQKRNRGAHDDDGQDGDGQADDDAPRADSPVGRDRQIRCTGAGPTTFRNRFIVRLNPHEPASLTAGSPSALGPRCPYRRDDCPGHEQTEHDSDRTVRRERVYGVTPARPG